MNRSHSPATYVLFALLAAACLLPASCNTVNGYEDEDRAFGRQAQEALAEKLSEQVDALEGPAKAAPAAGTQPAALPAGFAPKWQKKVGEELFENAIPATHGLEDLFARTLVHSRQVKVFSDIPLIRETGIQEATGEFDHRAFGHAFYSMTDEPVGSTLTTGMSGRYHRYRTEIKAGVKRKYHTGGEVTLSEMIARTTSNSIYFIPHRQAEAVLALTIRQPLLKGAGVKVNRSRIRIAKIDSEIARQEFIRQAESHLLEVARAYWSLYLSRAVCVQRRELVAATADVVAKLARRRDLDALESELLYARSLLAQRRADLVRSEMAIQSSEDRIKALVNDPELLTGRRAELLPADAPATAPMKLDVRQAAGKALETRPEIRQALEQYRAAMIRKNVAENQALPQLDFILETAMSGLDRAGPITAAMDDQWRHPGLLIGLKWEHPVENNAAKARLIRRRLEIRQIVNQLRATVDTVLLEVKISAREVNTSFREMLTRHQALQAAEEDLRVLRERWANAGGTKGAVQYLRLLLDCQQRLAKAQEDFAASSVEYNVAMVNLQRAQGTLLGYQDLQINRKTDDDDLPELELRKKITTPADSVI
ncbi:MAG: TolC family protein, partial [Planctomycetota bacterium]